MCAIAVRGWIILRKRSEPAAIPPTTSSPTTTTWHTYTDNVRGFTISYPKQVASESPEDHITLPEAVGGKERQLHIEASMAQKTALDAQGCIKLDGLPEAKNAYTKLTVNGVPFCMNYLDDGAAGSTYRTYYYTSSLFNNLVISVQMTVRFPTSVRVYAGCEEDAEQTLPRCVELAFNESRDTGLFGQIINTFKRISQ